MNPYPNTNNDLIHHKDQYSSSQLYHITPNVIPNTTKEESNVETTPTPRKRTRATPEQLSVLEKTFTINPSPNSRIREQLSRELNMSERSIQIWFQNRRAKVKNVAKKSSMLHDETLRMQYYASTAAAAACKAAVYQQQQKEGIKDPSQLLDPIKSNPDLYYYYYYYYFNQQQQQRQKHSYHPYNAYQSSSSVPPPLASLKTMPPPPPPPPPPSSSSLTTGSTSPSESTMWSKKQIHQQRARAHTIGPYYPSVDHSMDLNGLGQQENFLLHTTPTSMQPQQQEFLPYSSASPSLFEQNQQLTTWTDIPFYEDMMTPTTPSLFNATPYYDINANNPNITRISAEALQIGTWKRMTFEPNDLICQFDKETQSFSWCIQDGLSQFKMEVPQDLIRTITLQPLQARPGWARLVFELIEQEKISFYMYNNNTWVQCRDYTEDKQATVVSVHQLDGPALALKAELDVLLKTSEYLKSITTTNDTV